MAVCRCETHTPHGTKRRYIHSVRPVGYHMFDETGHFSINLLRPGRPTR
jgi:hypothetical protein